jgi:hypothetical protein
MRGFPQRILLSLACFVALAGILACPKPGPTPVVNPRDASDAAPAWNGGPATCLDFCRRGAVLKCAWAADTPAGATCVEVCANNQKAAIAPWDLSCRTAASVCDPPKCQ